MSDNQPTPETPSSDYEAMAPFWRVVRAILAGAPAMRCEAYLPKLPQEGKEDHKCRMDLSPFTNVYGDIASDLASKPFAKAVLLSPDASPRIAGEPNRDGVRSGGLVENIDAQGNSLHAFSSTAFAEGVNKGLTWIIVDHTRPRVQPVGRPLTQAEEAAQGLRPYWVHVPPENVIAAYSAVVDGEEALFHVRIKECIRRRDGWGEQEIERVRVMNREIIEATPDGEPLVLGPPTWTLYEERTNPVTGREEWVEVDAGAYSVPWIPAVPIFLGQREGNSFRVVPPLRDLAHMQIAEFRQEANIESISTLTAFPMLAGNGVQPPTDTQGAPIMVPVGPRSVLFAPPGGDGSHGEWKFIEPSAESLKFLEERLKTCREEMRTLGMQPLARANLTVVTSGNLSRKASSQVEKWAILFEDGLNRALAMTSAYLGEPDTTAATLYKDFAIEAEEGAEVTALLKAEAQGIISKRVVADEMKRRNVLADSYDHEADQLQLAEEQAGLEPEMTIDPITGQEIPPGGLAA